MTSTAKSTTTKIMAITGALNRDLAEADIGDEEAPREHADDGTIGSIAMVGGPRAEGVGGVVLGLQVHREIGDADGVKVPGGVEIDGADFCIAYVLPSVFPGPRRCYSLV